MMEGSGTLESQLEATKVRIQPKDQRHASKITFLVRTFLCGAY